MQANEKDRMSESGVGQHDTQVGKKEKLMPLSVRFTQGAWDAIRGVAAANHVSMAELVRLTVAGNMADYLGTVKVLDRKQATEIKELLRELMDEMVRIRLELNRIGVNYNQEVRLKNLEHKYKGKYSLTDIQDMMREKDQIEQECRGFSKGDMDKLMGEYEAATQKVGEALWHIVE